MKYKCTITSGGGTEQDGGDFIVKNTPKTLTFECVRQPFFSAYNQMIDKKPVRISKFYKDGREAWKTIESLHRHLDYVAYMNNGHVARFWQDGSITVYPNQCGTPHYLEEIK
jgi:hypothetical protein